MNLKPKNSAELEARRYFHRSRTISKWWKPKAANDKYSREILNFVKAGEGETILDCGVGNGIYAIEMAKKGSYVIGLDLSREMLSICLQKMKEEGLRFELVLGDIQYMPFKLGIFSKAVCVRTLMHVPKYRLVVSELIRVIKPGALAIVENLNLLHVFNFLDRLEYIFAKRILGRDVAPHILRTPREIVDPVQNYQFDVRGLYVFLPVSIPALHVESGISCLEPFFSKLGRLRVLKYLAGRIIIMVKKTRTRKNLESLN